MAKRKVQETLWAAALVDDAERVAELLASGVHPDDADPKARGRTALIEAVVNRNHVILDLLLAAGANPDAAIGGGATALYLAADRADLHAVCKLLEAGADTSLCDEDGNDPLGQVVFYFGRPDSQEILDALLRAGADPHRKNLQGVSSYELSRVAVNARGIEWPEHVLRGAPAAE